MNQRVLAAPSEPRHIWKLDGPLEDAPADETPTSAWLHMAHAGPLPPIWDLLDCAQPQVETLHLLNLEEFTDLISRPRSFTTPSSVPISPSKTTWKRRSDCVTRDRTSRITPSQPHFSWTNWRPCPPSTSKPKLLPPSTRSALGLPSGMPTSFAANSGWPSRI